MFEIYTKTLKDDTFEKIDDFRPGCWVYVKDAKNEDLAIITKIADLELVDIKDSLDRFELPRIERIKDNIIIFLRHPSEVEHGLYTNTLTLILTHSYMMALSPDRSEIIENILESGTHLSLAHRPKLILGILSKVAQEYTSNIKRVRYLILEEEKKTKGIDNNTISILTKNEEILNQYLTSLIPMSNTLKMMAEGRLIALHEKDQDSLQDLIIGFNQSQDVCDVNIKSIRSLRDSYQIIFTNNVNQTIKLLTALTIVFHIPTITASLYGMNIAIPFQKTAGAFWIVMSIILLISLIVVLLFRRNRWL
jgi:magnesium transporter